ncbi:MAG: helix-turn-helix domain-containing protein [Bifidobacteriaceae bacterium]|nr:helix-turn-helix domain-containing protein [Bifidobacteriaceae bacterium]
MDDLPLASPLLSTYQAADYLGVPRQTLAQWRCAKPPKGPAFVVVGRFVKYKRADLDSWIDAQRIVTEPPPRPPAAPYSPPPRPAAPSPQRALTAPPPPLRLTWLPNPTASR